MFVSLSHPTDRPNFTVVHVNDLTLWFSYSTVIGFHFSGQDIIASENVWGPTTGKHLNHFSKHENRLPRAEFVEKLNAALSLVGAP